MSGSDELASLIAQHECVVFDLQENRHHIIVREGKRALGPKLFHRVHSLGENFLLLVVQKVHVKSFELRRFHEHFRYVSFYAILFHLSSFEKCAGNETDLQSGSGSNEKRQ